LYFQKCSF